MRPPGQGLHDADYVTYDMNFAKNVATRVLHLEHGVVYRDGKPKEILADPRDVL